VHRGGTRPDARRSVSCSVGQAWCERPAVMTTARPNAAHAAIGSGQVVVLNGVPRSGKSSIAHAMQHGATEPWLNLGVDATAGWLPEDLRPGIGLRPGGERPDLEDAVVRLYRALFDSVAAHARQGFNVVVDLGLHDSYSRPRSVARDGARRLRRLPVLFVGVRATADAIWQRRSETWDQHRDSADPSLVDAVARWPVAVHTFGYDLEVDTSELSPAECAERVLTRLHEGPPGSAFGALASS
jgi:chloramphenicol 3-O phosphotransferase